MNNSSGILTTLVSDHSIVHRDVGHQLPFVA